MAEFYRFRSMKYLLGEEYQELENQAIYFASSEELNDPMEDFRDIVWIGDKVVWTNLFKHYVYCLHQACLLFGIAGGSRKLDAGNISIFGRWDEMPTPQAKTLFEDIWERCLNVPKIREIIEVLANTKRKIRYLELGYYLRRVHFFFLAEILRSYIAHQFLAESEMPPFLEESEEDDIERLLTLIMLAEEVQDEKQLDVAFFVCEMRENNLRIKQQYYSREISARISQENNQLVMFDFPTVYLNELERLLWSKWYAACFTASYHNSSVWGHYADNHKGACLIFEALGTNDTYSLALNKIGSKGLRNMTFHRVSYAHKAGEVDFFRYIGRLPVSALKELWYTDQEGNISESATHLESDDDGDSWRENYWNFFYRDITIKTGDWSYEQEYRLILEGDYSKLDENKNRTLTYNFNSLKGIIFGIKTSEEDKLRIIKIIEKKCREINRTDFKLFQAYYSPEHGDIRKYEVEWVFSDVNDNES